MSSQSTRQMYSKNYFFSGKAWGDGYSNYDVFCSRDKHPWAFLVERIIELKPSGRVLDVGCALGNLLSFFPDSFEKFGVDISEFAIETAKQRFPSVNFRVADISGSRPFKTRFDVITAFDVLEHTLNLRGALKNIHAMLKNEGMFVMAVPVASRVHHLLAFLGRSFLTTMESHIVLTTAKAWREIILPEFFEIENEFPVTWGKKHLPFIDIFHVFFLKKKRFTRP